MGIRDDAGKETYLETKILGSPALGAAVMVKSLHGSCITTLKYVYLPHSVVYALVVVPSCTLVGVTCPATHERKKSRRAKGASTNAPAFCPAELFIAWLRLQVILYAYIYASSYLLTAEGASYERSSR
jgi:hypothetical protein